MPYYITILWFKIMLVLKNEQCRKTVKRIKYASKGHT